MPDTETNARPDNFANAPLDEAVGRLVRVIRAERPQVIITYRDEQNFYPHPDHIRVHEISGPAFELAGDPEAYPGARRAVAAVEALLRRLVDRAREGAARGVPRTRRGEPVRVVVRARLRHGSHRRLHDAHRRRRLPAQAARGAARAPHAGRPERASGCAFPTTSSARCSRGRSSSSPARSSTTPPGDGEYEDDLFAGIRTGAADRC